MVAFKANGGGVVAAHARLIDRALYEGVVAGSGSPYAALERDVLEVAADAVALDRLGARGARVVDPVEPSLAGARASTFGYGRLL